MQLGTVVSACNRNPEYICYVPLFIETWQLLFPEIQVKVVLISNTLPRQLLKYKHNIILFDPIPEVSTAFTTQIIRILYPALLPTDSGVLITDIDMIPLNRDYYIKGLDSYSDNVFIVYNNCFEPSQYSICYNLATPKTWSRVFHIQTLQDVEQRIQLLSKGYHDSKDHETWYTDQVYLRTFVDLYPDKVVVKQSTQGFKRLDRCFVDQIISNMDYVYNSLYNKEYTDYHLPTWKEYKFHLLEIYYILYSVYSTRYSIQEFTFTTDDILCTDKYKEYCIKTGIAQYIKTDYLYTRQQFVWDNIVHPQIPLSKNLVIGHSDYSVTDESLKDIEYSMILCVNNQSHDPKIHSLPLGLTNPSLGLTFSQHDVLSQIQPQDKSNLLYLNYNPNTYLEERQGLWDTMKNKQWVKCKQPDTSPDGFKNYLCDLAQSKFVACPRGNGIDTHRLYESLYMKSIPIVKKNDIVYHNMMDLPILFIDDWNQVTEEYLNHMYPLMMSRQWNLNKLKIDYWLTYLTLHLI